MAKFKVTTQDPKGRSRHALEYPSEQAASEDARRALGEMARDSLPIGARASFRVRVEDAGGEEVYRASLVFTARSAKQARRGDGGR